MKKQFRRLNQKTYISRPIYSRRENIKFMNIEEGSQDQYEDTEEILRGFLERELGFVDAQNMEIRRVHRTGQNKDGKPRPILARFLRYKDVQKNTLLGTPPERSRVSNVPRPTD